MEAVITEQDVRLAGDHLSPRRRRRSDGPSRLPAPRRRPPARRARTGAPHAVIAATLAILALIGCVIAVLTLATQPTASRLEGEVASLNGRLGAAKRGSVS